MFAAGGRSLPKRVHKQLVHKQLSSRQGIRLAHSTPDSAPRPAASLRTSFQQACIWQSLTLRLVQTFEGSTHALLQEAGINLVDICKEEGFYITKRELSAPLKKRSRATFGDAAAPIDLPTPIELGQATQQ